MTRRVFSVVVALLISLVAVPISRASADPIVLIAGGSSVTIDDPLEGPITAHLRGTQQFLADPVRFDSGNGRIRCDPCGRPGSMFDMSPKPFLDTQDEGGGTVHLAGVTYEAGGLDFGQLCHCLSRADRRPRCPASRDERERSADDSVQAGGHFWSFAD